MHKGRLISSRKTCCINKDQYVQVNRVTELYKATQQRSFSQQESNSNEMILVN